MNRQQSQESAVRSMARMIQNQAVLDRLIGNTRADMREAVYKQLRTYVKFRPTPFWKMKFSDDLPQISPPMRDVVCPKCGGSMGKASFDLIPVTEETAISTTFTCERCGDLIEAELD